MYKPHFYGVEKETVTIDMDKVAAMQGGEAQPHHYCGASAYSSRDWDYARFRGHEIADFVWVHCSSPTSATPSGLIAAGLLKDPMELPHVPHRDVHDAQERSAVHAAASS